MMNDLIETAIKATHCSACQADNASTSFGIETLLALLAGRGWDPNRTRISRALPTIPKVLAVADIVRVLQTLRLPVQNNLETLAQAKRDDLPCLVFWPDGGFALLDDALVASVALADGTRRNITPETNVVVIAHRSCSKLDESPDNAHDLLIDLRPSVWPLFVSSLAISVLGLATPLAIMSVYNTAIPAHSLTFLMWLGLGLSLAFIAELAIRRIRSAAIVHLVAGAENLLGLSLLHKLITMPLSSLARSDAFQQRARLRQFEGLRDAMMGPLLHAALDLPFLILFGSVLVWISPPIGALALAFAVINLVGFALVGPKQRRLDLRASKAQSVVRRLVRDTVTQQDHIRRNQAVEHWRQKIIGAVDTAEAASHSAQSYGVTSRLILQSIIATAGICCGLFACLQVIEGRMNVGTLIAVLILVWRFLMPIQSLATAAEQFFSMLANLKMIDAVLKLPDERMRGVEVSEMKIAAPGIKIEQLSFRYPDAHFPVLAGVSMQVRQGEVVVICGRGLSGKSTLAAMIAGLYPPLTGRIEVGGWDTRHLACDDLRDIISFAPQEPAIFHGTLLQNLKIPNPLANEEDAWRALERAGIDHWVRLCPDGINHRLDVDSFAALPYAIQKGISLAMAFIRDAPIAIFDSPVAGLGRDQAQRIRQSIADQKSARATVLISNNLADFDLGDRFVVLDRGRVVMNENGAKGRSRATTLITPVENKHVA